MMKKENRCLYFFKCILFPPRMIYSTACSAKIPDSQEIYIRKIRVTSASTFLSCSTSTTHPFSLHSVRPEEITSLTAFLPPRVRFPQPLSRGELQGRQSPTSVRGFPDYGPTDFCVSKANFEELSSLRPLKRGLEQDRRNILFPHTFASCHRNGLIALYDCRINYPMIVMEGLCSHNNSHCIEFAASSSSLDTDQLSRNSLSHADENYLLVGDGPCIRLVDLRKRQVVDTTDFHSDLVNDVKFLDFPRNPPSSAEEHVTNKKFVLSSSEDGTLILSSILPTGGLSFEDSISFANCPLRNISCSNTGTFLVNTSVESISRVTVGLDGGTEEVLLRRICDSKRSTASSYVVDMFNLSGVDFSIGLEEKGLTFDLMLCCISDSIDLQKHHIGIFDCTDNGRLERIATLADCGSAVVRSCQPFASDSHESIRFITGDESGTLKIWKSS